MKVGGASWQPSATVGHSGTAHITSPPPPNTSHYPPFPPPRSCRHHSGILYYAFLSCRQLYATSAATLPPLSFTPATSSTIHLFPCRRRCRSDLQYTQLVAFFFVGFLLIIHDLALFDVVFELYLFYWKGLRIFFSPMR